MFDDNKNPARWRHAVALTLAAGMLAACHGGASDVVGGGGPAGANTSITLVAYSVPEPGWSKVIPAFNASPEGKGIQVIASYGASGDQSRGVVDGKPADIVNFSVEPDITRLVKAGKVSKDWDKDATKGIPFGSIVTLVVRPGNPKNIKDWDDLLRPDVEVITPSPLSSGSAKWNLLAPYVVKSGGGHDSQGRPRLHRQVGRPARQTAPRIGTRSHRRVRSGQRRRADQLRKRGDRHRATRKADHSCQPAADHQDREPGGRGDHQPAPERRGRVQELPVHRGGPKGLGGGWIPSGRPRDRGRGSRPVPGTAKSCGRSPISVAGRRWTPTLFDKKSGSITKIYTQATG